MKVTQFTFDSKHGWSMDPLPRLDSPETLVVAFSAPEFYDDPTPLNQLAAAFPQSHIIGCSTAGEIFGTQMQDHSLSVVALKFEQTRLKSAFSSVATSADSFRAGEAVARQLQGSDLRGVFVLSEGNHINGSELVRGITAVLPTTIVTGGLAGDGDRFQRTWVYCDRLPQVDHVVAVGFYGDAVTLRHGSQGGWDQFGLERVITRSEGNVLYELDGKPALQLYKDYLGDLAKGLPSTALHFPLALRSDNIDEQPIVRTILTVDEALQSMTFAGDIPQGLRAQLMKDNFDRLVDGAAGAAAQANQTLPLSENIVSIAVSCVGRRLVMGARIEEELEAVVANLPPQTAQIGFYSYGEISPTGGYCDLHNQTMTITTITEKLNSNPTV